MAQGMRGLTAPEQAEVREVYPGAVPWDRVRLCDGAGRNLAAMIAFRTGAWAITLRRTIYFGSHYSADFSTADAEHRELFFHEMTHVWQYATLGIPSFGVRYASNFIAVGFRRGRMYDYRSGDDFRSASLEAQAQMVGHYARALADRDTARQDRLRPSLSGTGLHRL